MVGEGLRKLDHYVYLLVDPDLGPFYIRRGQKGRALSHLRARGDSKKAEFIRRQTRQGKTPFVEILRHKLTEAEAEKVESAAIDLARRVMDPGKLLNEVRGYDVKHGIAKLEEIVASYSAKRIKIKERAVLINIARSYVRAKSAQELYDYTRSAWNANPKNRKLHPQYAFAVFQRIIREVYEITDWHEGGSTMKSTGGNGRPRPERSRQEFVGKLANNKMRHQYIGRSVFDDQFPPRGSNPVKYVNC
jgi:hypothetical protein